MTLGIQLSSQCAGNDRHFMTATWPTKIRRHLWIKNISLSEMSKSKKSVITSETWYQVCLSKKETTVEPIIIKIHPLLSQRKQASER